MRVRLGAACGIRGLSVFRWFAVIAIIGAVPAIPAGNFAITMRMTGQLRYGEGRVPRQCRTDIFTPAMWQKNKEKRHARVTVVPDDRLIIVDGYALCFDYTSPDGMHALQWDGKSGHTEWINGPNQALAPEDYDTLVAPYVTAWEQEQNRLEQTAAEAEAARLAEFNSEGGRFERLRAERDRRLAETDYLLMPDYPLSEGQRTVLQSYRQSLRDLPSQEGAPWDGGGEETPWPEIPTWVKA